MTALIGASAAKAAFPGSNGLLAVQPRTGGGILLVGADGAGARRICVRTPVGCGTPQRPRWSPDGRALVFAGPAIRIVYPDGSCMDCAFGAALRPAFEPGGTLISFLQGGRLLVDGIDTIRKSAPAVAGLSDAVWSADGRLAVVRRGELWAGRPGHLIRLAVATEPSWAPSSRTIAARQGGWIVLIRVRDGQVRRLVPGGAPAFSPDGRWIAYIAPDHRLRVVSAGPAPVVSRPVGNIRAVSVDWQPRPRGRNPGCVGPPGSRVVASSRAAVISGDRLPLPVLDFANAPPIAYMGCLRADGRERLLDRFVGNNVDSASYISKAALAAPYAALEVDNIDEHYGGRSSTLQVFDLRTGKAAPGLGGQSLNCDYCAGFDDVVVGPDGVTAVHTRTIEPEGSLSSAIDQVACAPSSTTCVAADDAGYGNVLMSTDPSGGAPAWSVDPLGTELGLDPRSVACPSTSLCVGVGPRIFTSTNPAGGAATWQSGDIGTYLSAVACPTSSLCVASGTDGTIAASTNPAGGPTTWSSAGIDSHPMDAIFCSAQPQCFASDSAGTVYTSTNPAGGAAAWAVSPTTPAFYAGTCPTTTLCIELSITDILTSTNPGGGGWTPTPISGLISVSCPSAALCLAVGGGGRLAASTSPASQAWTTTTIDAGRRLTSIACPSISLCVATDAVGHIVVSTDPTGGPAAWTSSLVLGDPCTETTDCSVEQIVVSDGAGRRSVDSSELPGDGPFLTSLILRGDTLSWVHDGAPRSAVLKP